MGRLADKYGKDEITATLNPTETDWTPSDPPETPEQETAPSPRPPRRRSRAPKRNRTANSQQARSDTAMPTLLGRPRLTQFHWNTSLDLWNRYAKAALELSKDGTMNVSASELIRASLDATLPDLTTESGLDELVNYASNWQDNYVRGSARHSVLLRIPEPTYEALQQARRDLQGRGIALPLNMIISALLAVHDPNTLPDAA